MATPSINRIFVRPLKPDSFVIAGTEVTTKDPKVRGEIVAVGKGEAIEGMGLKVGMTAIFGQFAGEDLNLDGIDLKVLFVDQSIESELLGYDDNSK